MHVPKASLEPIVKQVRKFNEIFCSFFEPFCHFLCLYFFSVQISMSVLPPRVSMMANAWMVSIAFGVFVQKDLQG